MPAKHLVVHGRVQGVWYRGWAVETARALGLTGWVRNRGDGTVEAVVAGDAAAVSRFIAEAHRGPAAARVTAIDVSDCPPQDFDGFGQRPTA